METKKAPAVKAAAKRRLQEESKRAAAADATSTAEELRLKEAAKQAADAVKKSSRSGSCRETSPARGGEDGGFFQSCREIGNGVPLCSDLPARHFQMKGATYRLLGASSTPIMMSDPNEWQSDSMAKRFRLQATVFSPNFVALLTPHHVPPGSLKSFSMQTLLARRKNVPSTQ